MTFRVRIGYRGPWPFANAGVFVLREVPSGTVRALEAAMETVRRAARVYGGVPDRWVFETEAEGR